MNRMGGVASWRAVTLPPPQKRLVPKRLVALRVALRAITFLYTAAATSFLYTTVTNMCKHAVLICGITNSCSRGISF